MVVAFSFLLRSGAVGSSAGSARPIQPVVQISRLRPGFEAALGAAWLAFVIHAFVPGDGWVDTFFKDGVYYGLIVAASAGCLLRAVAYRHDRWAWGSIGAGLTVWTAGDLYYLLRLEDLDVTPVPSLADVFYLAYFPLIYVGVILLMRDRVGGATKALWLDGITAALTVAAVACSLLLGPLRSAAEGSALAIATNLSYPLGDVVLLSLLTALAAAQRFRFDRTSLMLVAGLVSAAAADVAYLVQGANGTYTEGGMTDAFWAASLLLIGAAAWRDTPIPRTAALWRPIAALPLTCASVATLLLAAATWHPLGTLGTVLAAAAILTVLMRLAVTLQENRRLLETASGNALTDALTGLRNRRALMRDLESMATRATPDDPVALVLFDLNGFKSYNDRFGHPAGDALLQRLGFRLMALEKAGTRVYRLGGDEFSLLATSDVPSAASLIDRAVEALSEDTEGFQVSASFGAAFIPQDAVEISEALRLADVRLYSRKATFHADHDRPHEELLRILNARAPRSAETRRLAAEIATDLAVAVGLDADKQREVARATLLRDVGTLALPDDVAQPNRPLTDAEARLIHQHPLIGERIVSAMPALRPLAPVIRSSYECWDGSGFPDGLHGARIPLTSRIVAISAARAQAHAEACGTTESASSIVARQAGKQLDPELVRLSSRLRSRAAEPPAS
jgi:two-component system, cell cycle response regulator